MIASCDKKDEPESPSLELDKTTLTIPNAGGSDILKITSNAYWTLTTDASWVTFSKSNGTGNMDVTVSVTEQHANLSARTATIKVATANLPEKTVTLTQFGEEKLIIVKSVSIPITDSIPSLGVAFSVTISANVPVSVDIDAVDDWIKPAATTAASSLVIDKVFHFVAATNYDVPRAATLKFFEEGNASLSTSITLNQKRGEAKKIEIVSSGLSGIVSDAGTTFTSTINTNVTVVAVTPEWITSVKVNNSTFNFTVLANTDYPNRKGDILFKDSLSDLSQKLTVTQRGIAGSTNADSLALVALYNATNGANWKVVSGTKSSPWNLSRPMTTWYGVTISGARRVVDLSLVGLGLDGPLPEAFYNLPMLIKLRIIQDTKLSGSLSPKIANMNELTTIEIYQCPLLTGSIPAEIGSLSKLGNLSLYTNALTGSMPASLGSLSNLTSLLLYGNKLTGSIPSELGSLSKLSRLDLSDNRLSGAIPEEIYNLRSLTNLALSGQSLSGSISPKIGQLASVDYLYLSNNQLSGTIPAELFRLEKLKTLYLHYNNLTGSLPNVNASIQVLEAHNNKLSGSVLAETKASPRYGAWYLCPQKNGFGLTDVGDNTSCTTPVAQANPTDFAGTYVSNTQINLTWKDNSTTETAFVIERSTKVDGPFEEVVRTRINAVAFSDKLATPSDTTTVYYYRIYALLPGSTKLYAVGSGAEDNPMLITFIP